MSGFWLCPFLMCWDHSQGLRDGCGDADPQGPPSSGISDNRSRAWISNLPTTRIHQVHLHRLPLRSAAFLKSFWNLPSAQEPSMPVEVGRWARPALSLLDHGVLVAPCPPGAKWVFHLMWAFLPLRQGSLWSRKTGQAPVTALGPLAVCTFGFWGPCSVALCDRTSPAVRTCRSVWRIVLRVEALEHFIGGGHWRTALRLLAIAQDVSPEKATWKDERGSWWTAGGRKGPIWVQRGGRPQRPVASVWV